MSDTYRSEAEALADALPPYAASFDLPGGESTSAALHRAEAEIERLRGNEKRWAAEVEHAEAERDKAIRERDSARTEVDVLRRSEALEVVQLESKVRRVEAERDSSRADLASARDSLDARNRALIRARAQIGELIAQATSRHGTTLCPRCGKALAAEVDAEKSTTEGEPQWDENPGTSPTTPAGSPAPAGGGRE